MLWKFIGLILFVLYCSFLQISGIEAGVMYVDKFIPYPVVVFFFSVKYPVVVGRYDAQIQNEMDMARTWQGHSFVT